MEKNILVFNPGSATLKFQIISFPNKNVLIKGLIDEIGKKQCRIVINEKEKKLFVKNHHDAIILAIKEVTQNHIDVKKINATATRVVHGGEDYKEATLINQKVINSIDKLKSLAPLHNPLDLKCINTIISKFPHIPHYAVFDTAFHQSLPKESYLYAIPLEYYKKYKIRKYGFHGISHKYLLERSKKILKKNSLNIITCHLGNGASICAIKNNKSIQTSMGFTPLEGLIMGTRSGNIDPEIVSFISNKLSFSPKQVIDILNKKSGLKAIAGNSDFRIIHKNSQNGDKNAKLAIAMFEHRLLEYIGAYIALLGKVDAIVFSGGIGEGAYYLRKDIAKHININLDEKKNNKNKEGIISKNSKIKILMINSNEELQIAQETYDKIKKD